MKHKHHIIPKHMGGTNEPSNIIELTVEEHAQAHLELYKIHGKHEDLCAYHMLSGNIEQFRKVYGKLGGTKVQQKRRELGFTGHELFYGREVSKSEITQNASKGGKVQGEVNSKNGHMKKIQELSDCVFAGKKGGASTIRLGKGAFGDPNERKKSAALGGKAQGKINGENGHCKKISQQYWDKVKSGEIERVKRMWITNGIDSRLVIIGEKIDDGWYNGKSQTKKV
jgi:hypothetical protein